MGKVRNLRRESCLQFHAISLPWKSDLRRVAHPSRNNLERHPECYQSIDKWIHVPRDHFIIEVEKSIDKEGFWVKLKWVNILHMTTNRSILISHLEVCHFIELCGIPSNIPEGSSLRLLLLWFPHLWLNSQTALLVPINFYVIVHRPYVGLKILPCRLHIIQNLHRNPICGSKFWTCISFIVAGALQHAFYVAIPHTMWVQLNTILFAFLTKLCGTSFQIHRCSKKNTLIQEEWFSILFFFLSEKLLLFFIPRNGFNPTSKTLCQTFTLELTLREFPFSKRGTSMWHISWICFHK